ncbi:hypothetical protein [Halococcus sediminicola]|uniref:hypothetical protein n=1 Tax=Halococcus sediminicola TaxID=1264579 RepID=UPI000678EE14|nr:hypothetical protein [Halococcus sediminicola]
MLWYIPDEDSEENANVDTDADERGDVDMALKRLSTELGEAITVGDIIYEDGDKHPADAES